MGVITCACCGAKVNDAAPRCPECGTDPRTGPVCPACGAQVALGSRDCPACGSTWCPNCAQPVAPDVRFCSGCGASLAAPGEPGQSTQHDGGHGQTLDEAVRIQKLGASTKRASFWLFAIAGFTLFNAIEWVSHQSLRMVIGLSVTRQLTFLIWDHPQGQAIMIAAAVAAAAVFSVLGLLVLKGQPSALLIGAALYGMDLALFLIRVRLDDPVGLFFRALALFALIYGYLAILRLQESAAVSPPSPAVAETPPPPA